MTHGFGNKAEGSGLALILAIAAIGVGVIGWGSPAPSKIPDCTNNVPAKLQCGTVTFTLSATTSNTQTITFPTAFASTPGHFGLDIPTPAAWPAVSITTAAPIAAYCFICPGNTGQSFTWTSMPAVATEIFGDANREHQIFTTSVFSTATITGGSFRASVDCITGSTSANAVLEIQYSTDDATWFDLANVAGTADIPIDAAVNCPAPGTIVLASNGNGVAINANFPGSSNRAYLRVVGINGNGVGDNPAFAWINLSIKGLSTVVTVPCVLDQPAALSATSVQVRLRCFASTTVTSTFRWTAHL